MSKLVQDRDDDPPWVFVLVGGGRKGCWVRTKGSAFVDEARRRLSYNKDENWWFYAFGLRSMTSAPPLRLSLMQMDSPVVPLIFVEGGVF